MYNHVWYVGRDHQFLLHDSSEAFDAVILACQVYLTIQVINHGTRLRLQKMFTFSASITLYANIDHSLRNVVNQSKLGKLEF